MANPNGPSISNRLLNPTFEEDGSRFELKFNPGSLWESAKSRARQAVENGALRPVSTTLTRVERDGVRYVVRALRDDDPKATEQNAKRTNPTSKRFDPFLPYDEDFFVSDITDTHVCLLNKFTVIANHLLLVTREFVDQRTRLGLADFVATAACLAEIDGLAFYNAGPAAGASESHRHLQLVPLPMDGSTTAVPIEAAFFRGQRSQSGHRLRSLPFNHAFKSLNLDAEDDLSTAARSLHESYLSMLRWVGLGGFGDDAPGAYNLLLTRRWMLLAPRRRESFAGIPVNALGFAGSLLVRDSEQMATIERIGPMGILQGVAEPIPAA